MEHESFIGLSGRLFANGSPIETNACEAQHGRNMIAPLCVSMNAHHGYSEFLKTPVRVAGAADCLEE